MMKPGRRRVNQTHKIERQNWTNNVVDTVMSHYKRTNKEGANNLFMWITDPLIWYKKK